MLALLLPLPAPARQIGGRIRHPGIARISKAEGKM
jgi:hypothetical protein